MYVLHLFAIALWYSLAIWVIFKYELPGVIKGVFYKIYVYIRDL